MQQQAYFNLTPPFFSTSHSITINTIKKHTQIHNPYSSLRKQPLLYQQPIRFVILQLIIVMERQYLSNKPLHYAKISLDKRIKLVDMVINKQIPVSKASKKLQIKLSTAKLILKKFKEQASFFESRAQKKKRITDNYPLNNFSNCLPPPFSGQFLPPMMSLPHYEQQFMMMPPFPLFSPQNIAENINMLSSSFPQLVKTPAEQKSGIESNLFWTDYQFPNTQ